MTTTRIKSRAIFCLAVALIAAFTSTESRAQDDKTCLDYAYPKGEVPGSQGPFDKSYDALNIHGASFSCGPAIAASKARDALESFRYGVLYRDKARLDAVLQYPLTVRISKTLDAAEEPKVVSVHNFQEWSTLQKEEMTKIQIAAIACSWLGNVTVSAGIRSPGFFINDGMVWFQRSAGSAKVKVTSINLMPLSPEMLTSSCSP
jgi:hypothetical protein